MTRQSVSFTCNLLPDMPAHPKSIPLHTRRTALQFPVAVPSYERFDSPWSPWDNVPDTCIVSPLFLVRANVGSSKGKDEEQQHRHRSNGNVSDLHLT